ncbi:MAG: hypothetical protein LWW90_06740 [Candidatus Desulfofervidus auxilii]|nr:hypothetical protein [Candidatus Desulfofervidus auxilii]
MGNDELHRTDNVPLLFLQNKRGTRGCYLKNSLYPPYKKPRLPFGERSAIIHRLLRPLKVAHSLLVNIFEEMVGIDPEKYRLIREIYRAELYDFDADYYELGKIWFQNNCPFPMTIVGFYIQSWSSERYAFSLELTSLNLPGKLGFPDDLDSSIFYPVSLAARFYNDCVAELYDHDLLLFPSEFCDALSSFYPAYPLPENTILLEF